MPPLDLAASSMELSLAFDSDGPDTPDIRLNDLVLQLFDEHAAAIRRYALSFGLPPAAAEDVVQEAYLALFAHLRRGRPQTHLKGWLYRVTHNLALKHRTRAARWASADNVGGLTLVVADPGANPEQRLADRERRQRLRAVARALPQRDRQCLCLRADGFNYRDIATILGVSLGSVAKSLTRAFTRLANSEPR